MKAAGKSQTKVVQILLKAGADFNAKNNKNQFALGIATNKGNSEIIELLKKAGAKK